MVTVCCGGMWIVVGCKCSLLRLNNYRILRISIMEWTSLAARFVFLYLMTLPGSESENTQNIRDGVYPVWPTEQHYHNSQLKYRENQNELDVEMDYSFTNRLVGRYRYQGPVLGEREKLKVKKRIIDEFTDAHRDRSRVAAEDENNINNKSTDMLALPYEVREGWQLDDTLINRHFQLLNDASILEECGQRQWTQWSSWSACSSHCGFASRFQYRDCIFMERVPGKKDCGYFSFRDCKGKDMNRIDCLDLPQCIEITSWGKWSECSALCHGKFGVRKRFLIKESSRGTKQKLPESRQVESCQGTRPDCAGWSQWSRCSVSCSNQVGIRERTLVITTPDNLYRRDDSRLQMEPCVGQRILCEEWMSWSAWSSCDCKRRQKMRERVCERRFVFKTSSIGIRVASSLCRGQNRMSMPCSPADGTCKIRSRRKNSKKRRRPFLGSLKSKRKRLRLKKRVPGCVMGCQGVPFGRYPSCRSCFHYWQCYSRRRKERMCAKRRRWDNKARKCLPWSSTCPGV